MAKNDAVKAWLPAIRKIRTDLGLDERQYPDWLVLALIDIESDGDPSAHRPNSQFYGLLQIGKKNAADLGKRNTSFDGQGEASIEAFFQYQEKYAYRHGYDPQLIALTWKAGPGTVKRYTAIQRTQGDDAATGYLASIFGGSPVIYLRKFARESRFWSGGQADLTSSPVIAPVSNVRVTLEVGCDGSSLDGATTSESASGMLEQSLQASQQYLNANYGTALNGYVDPNLPTPADPAQQGGVRRVIYIDQNESLQSFELAFNAEPGSNFIWPMVSFTAAGTFGEIRATAVGGGKNPKKLGVDAQGRQKTRRHRGLDLRTGNNVNQPVYCIAPGEVIVAGAVDGLGYAVYVSHGNGITTRYGHLQSTRVKVGHVFTAAHIGTPDGVLGISGTTESSRVGGQLVTKHDQLRYPHLHLELRVNKGVIAGGTPVGGLKANAVNYAVDPVPLLQGALLPGQVRERIDADQQAIATARDGLGALLLQSDTEHAARQIVDAYDVYSAFQRADLVSKAGRQTFWDVEKTQNQQRQQQVQQVMDLNGADIAAKVVSSATNYIKKNSPPDAIAASPADDAAMREEYLASLETRIETLESRQESGTITDAQRQALRHYYVVRTAVQGGQGTLQRTAQGVVFTNSFEATI